MRRADRVDANQAEIVSALRSVGASVQSLHTVKGGCPDILVGRQGRNYLMEIKDGDKPRSQARLNELQEFWHARWSGEVLTVRSVDEALRAVGVL